MAKLEELTAGSVVEGILPGEPITVVSTRWYGSASLEVFYKTHQGSGEAKPDGKGPVRFFLVLKIEQEGNANVKKKA